MLRRKSSKLQAARAVTDAGAATHADVADAPAATSTADERLAAAASERFAAPAGDVGLTAPLAAVAAGKELRRDHSVQCVQCHRSSLRMPTLATCLIGCNIWT